MFVLGIWGVGLSQLSFGKKVFGVLTFLEKADRFILWGSI